MADDLKAIGEIGLHDALRGVTRDECSYRSAARRAAWMQGWHKGQQMQQDMADRAAITDQDKETHSKNITRLRALLKTT